MFPRAGFLSPVPPVKYSAPLFANNGYPIVPVPHPMVPIPVYQPAYLMSWTVCGPTVYYNHMFTGFNFDPMRMPFYQNIATDLPMTSAALGGSNSTPTVYNPLEAQRVPTMPICQATVNNLPMMSTSAQSPTSNGLIPVGARHATTTPICHTTTANPHVTRVNITNSMDTQNAPNTFDSMDGQNQIRVFPKWSESS